MTKQEFEIIAEKLRGNRNPQEKHEILLKAEKTANIAQLVHLHKIAWGFNK